MGDHNQRAASEAAEAAPRGGWATSGDPGAGGPMALRSALDRKTPPAATHATPRGAFDMVESGGGAESDSPWDAEAAEALARIYDAEMGAAPRAPVYARQTAPQPIVHAAAAVTVAKPAPAAEPNAHWLEERIAEIADKVERSFAELQPERSMELLSGRFDDFESRMSAVLHEVASSKDIDSLKMIEAHIEELARHAEETNTQFNRLTEIEGQLATVVDRLTRIEESEPGFDQTRFGADLQALIKASVEEASERLSGPGDSEAQGRRLDDLRGLIVTFMDDRRRGDEETTVALETMQEAMLRVLDKVEALELMSAGPHSAASKEASFATFPAEPSGAVAGHGNEFAAGEPLARVADEIVARTTPGFNQAESHREPELATFADPHALPGIADEHAVPRDDLAHEQGTPAGRTIDRMRQDLIAEARRAKQQADANAAAEQQKAARAAKPTDRRKAIIAEEKPPAGKRTISRKTMIAALLLLIAIPALVVAVPRFAKKSAAPAAATSTLQQKAAPVPANGASDVREDVPAASDPAKRSDTQEPASSVVPSQVGELPDSAPGILFANTDKSLSDEQVRRAYEQLSLAERSSRLSGSATNVTPAALAAEAPPMAAATGPASGEAAGQLDLPPASVGPLSLRTAAANGDPSAQFEVGARLAEGKGIDQNFTEAARWYQRAAAQGFAQAQYRLATLYERGLGMKKDLARARNWYQRAAEAGNVKAMHNLAVLSAGRAGEAPDYQTASRWFERAAGLGLADSQYNLAVLFENGLGVAQDNKRAYQWYALAARSGDKESLRKRDALRAELPVGEVAEIDRMITDWRAEASNRLANDPRAAGEDWKKRVGADANG